MKRLIIILLLALLSPVAAWIAPASAQVYMGVEGDNGYVEVNPITGKTRFMITNDDGPNYRRHKKHRKHHKKPKKRHHRHNYRRYGHGYRCPACGHYYKAHKHHR